MGSWVPGEDSRHFHTERFIFLEYSKVYGILTFVLPLSKQVMV